MSTKLERKIGLVAGWGQFPVEVAKALKRQGHKIVGLGIKEHADPILATICDEFQFFGVGRMGAQTRYLRRHGVTEATLAGKIFKARILQPRYFLKHLPDPLTLKFFYSIFVSKTKDRKDDTLLTTVTDLYASQGIQFMPATDYATHLLVKPGNLTVHKPTKSELRDIEFGWKMAREMGRLDIGQSVVVNNQAVMAVEAIEGTDECIRRGGTLAKSGFSVVKVAKPNQDMRFDVPTIGAGTIRTIHEAGGRVLAIEARKTIILNESETVELANRLGIVIVAME